MIINMQQPRQKLLPFIWLLAGWFLLTARATQAATNSMYQTSQEREIIVLNSTNFNTELIQHNHPFPHIKLIEYYLPYCGICRRFKQTYVRLAEEIFSWRNVIRASAIDVGVSNNSPIAHSWSIDVVPTLRIHPPPDDMVASKLDRQLAAWSHGGMSESDLQRSMFQEYSGANLMISSLGVVKYTNDSKRDSVADKVALLKQDLLRYIEKYVRDHRDQLPETWPNLRPVTERTLADLKQNHPRQELFLIVEANQVARPADALTPDGEPILGLQIMMELSSSAAWKAVRYLRASDNRELIEDVAAYKRRELAVVDQNESGEQNSSLHEQVELLESLLAGKMNQNNVILIHIDDSYSPSAHPAGAPSTKFSFLEIITDSDFITTEQHLLSLAHDKDSSSGVGGRSKRGVERTEAGRLLTRRSERDDANSNLGLSRKLALVTLYINQTYIPTNEDREFISALATLDENPTSQSTRLEVADKFQIVKERKVKSSSPIEGTKQRLQADDQATNRTSTNSTLKQFLSKLNPSNSDSFLSSAITKFSSSECQSDDYEDKLKAIRYIFLQEVPRKSFADKSPAEKAEKLNTLINLASVIKAYFPLPDLASVQFIDAVQNYLSKQQTLLLASLNNGDKEQRTLNNFDLRSLKQFIRSIEEDGKRLPEIRNWKHCKYGGYPCALWRLFHTLTAFEHEKLSQIYQLSTGSQSQPPPMASPELIDPLAQQTSQPQAQVSEASDTVSAPATTTATSNTTSQLNSPPAPVERLVSPPSTTTSLSLTIATPISAHGQQQVGRSYNSKKYASEIAELPTPVLLVMRDYVVNFFSCEECARNFRQETADLSFERIRQQEPAEFSVLWLWETHNRVSKRLSINPETNPPEHPKKWFPAYEQCSRCYRRPPSFLKDTSVELAAIFHESIEWNRDEILNFLQREFTQQPMSKNANIFGYSLPYGFDYVIIIGLLSLLLIVLLRCASYYIERQRRHKASMLNAVHYSEELQRA